MNDLSRQTHDNLDNEITSNRLFSSASVESHGAGILNLLLISCVTTYANIWPIDPTKIDVETCGNLLASRPEIQSLLQTAHANRKYAKIRNLPEFHKTPKQNLKYFIGEERRALTQTALYRAYTQPFRGHHATQFLDYLLVTDARVREGKVIYAKSVSIVQSSGTGKSRMLTEIGKQIFTLPICLRGRNDPGYPPADHVVFDYFSKVNNDNDLSISAHAAIARFIGAAHTTMLNWLQAAQTNRNAEELHTYWHTLMEGSVVRTDRERFFREVVELANSMPTIMLEQGKIFSPKRRADHEADRPEFNIHDYSDAYYKYYAKQATEDLVEFTSHLTQWPMVVTYFDEAHLLDESLWSMLRLLSQQDVTTSMWYIFADTKSSISYFNPAPANRHSKRLREEGVHLLPPYIAVGFDQIVISEDRDGVAVKMGELQSIKHFAKYGRPLWNAQYDGQDDAQIRLAADKLICEDFMKFDPTDPHQVLAVLSQRICVDTALFSSEALQHAERAVASHMKLLTGFAPDGLTFYTYSPSEPILALAAAQLLYDNKRVVLGKVLNTFTKNLCEAGVVEKGLLGELAGRTLLIVARDLAAPKNPDGYPNLLTPVLLMDFLDKLFGNESWCRPHQKIFRKAFEDTYVNFTHWIVTKDPLPERPFKKLLANLWARGAALQYQVSLDLQIVTYKGSIAPDSIFDVNNLSVAVFQIKNKTDADTAALRSLRPVGLPRNPHEPLPYLTVAMELGNDSNYRGHEGPIKATATPWSAKSETAFSALWAAWEEALRTLEVYEEKKKKAKKETTRKKGQEKVRKDPVRTKLLDNIKSTRAAIDSYNRYTINVRGASPAVYGSLQEANIVTEFTTLIKVTMPSPTAQEAILQHMRPLEHLHEGSASAAWMTDYGENRDEEDSDDDGDDDEDDPMSGPK